MLGHPQSLGTEGPAPALPTVPVGTTASQPSATTPTACGRLTCCTTACRCTTLQVPRGSAAGTGLGGGGGRALTEPTVCREHHGRGAVPHLWVDGCPPQEILSQPLLGRLRQVQLHGQAPPLPVKPRPLPPRAGNCAPSLSLRGWGGVGVVQEEEGKAASVPELVQPLARRPLRVGTL